MPSLPKKISPSPISLQDFVHAIKHGDYDPHLPSSRSLKTAERTAAWGSAGRGRSQKFSNKGFSPCLRRPFSFQISQVFRKGHRIREGQ